MYVQSDNSIERELWGFFTFKAPNAQHSPKFKAKILLIVPSKSLVEQMFKDFAAYSVNDPSWDVSKNCSKVMQGYDKTGLNDVVITTWQSAIVQPPEWFKGYDVVMVDEAHEAKG